MKKSLIIFFMLFAIRAAAQTTLLLQPHFANGIEGTLYWIDTTSTSWPGNPNQYVCDNTYKTYPDFCYNGDLSISDSSKMRHIIRFGQLSDTTLIPHNAVIDNAVLHLYGVPSSGYGNWGNTYFTGSPWASSGPNSGWLYELADSFDANTVTWRNAPGIMHNDSVAIAASSAQWNEDDSLDVTTMVTDMITHSNTGFLARMQVEMYGHERVFGSCYYTDSTKHPSLKVTYHIPTTGAVSINNTNLSVSVYPNPAKEVLHTHIDGRVTSAVTISIYSMLGEKISCQTFDNGGKDLAIPVTALPTGVYILETMIGQAVTMKRFIKE